jgi:pantetheine-phosphate adenylyltransferase
MANNRLAVVAGSFDPFTNGHLDLVDRASRLFDRVVVAVLVNRAKHTLFTLEERLEMLRAVLSDRAIVEVDSFDGLLVDYVRRRGAVAIVRGLRTTTEVAEEWPVAMMHRQFNPACETIFLLPGADTMHISSRIVREIASFGGPVDALVPPLVAARLAERLGTA